MIFAYLLAALPCDSEGNFLPEGSLPNPKDNDPNDWSPYEDVLQFQCADFLYRKVEMSGPDIDFLMDLWAFSKAQEDDLGPFELYDHMYATIDATKHGDAPWKYFVGSYDGETGPDSPSWQTA